MNTDERLYVRAITAELKPIKTIADLDKYGARSGQCAHLLINGDIVTVKKSHLEAYTEHHIGKSSPTLQLLTVEPPEKECLTRLSDWLGKQRDRCRPDMGGPVLFIIDPHMDFLTLSEAFGELTSGLRNLELTNQEQAASVKGPEGKSGTAEFAGTIVFASRYSDDATPPLDAREITATIDLSRSGISEEKIKEHIKTLRQNQFFIRMVARYGWGPFCHVSRLAAHLDRIAIDFARDPRERSFLTFTSQSLQEWFGDVDRIWTELEKRIQYGPWAGIAKESGYFDWQAVFSEGGDSKVRLEKTLASKLNKRERELVLERLAYWKSESKKYAQSQFKGIDRDSLLVCLAHVHQYGRLDRSTTEDISARLNVPWFIKKAALREKGVPDSTDSAPDDATISEGVSPVVRRERMNWLTTRTLGVWEDHREKYDGSEYRDILESFEQPSKKFEDRPSPSEEMDTLLGKLDLTAAKFHTESSHDPEREGKPAVRRLIGMAGVRNALRADQFVFGMLVDFSQMLSKGCAHWARESRRDEKEDASSGQPDDAGPVKVPIRILLIGDRIADHIERRRHYGYLQSAFTAAFPLDVERQPTVDLHVVEYNEERNWDAYEWWVSHLRGDKRVEAGSLADYVAHAESDGSRSVASLAKKKRINLLEYDIILVEAECQTRFVGPSIIQWLDNAIDEYSIKRGEVCDKAEDTVKPRPQLLVLSRDASAGQSFLCLWLGAQAFASKSRIFGLPALLTMANVGQWAPRPTGKKLRPNYAVVEGIIPHQRNRLKSRRPQDLIRGDEWDRHWVRRMPKADLHYHIGTSISLNAITAMAANTAGYVIVERSSEGGSGSRKGQQELAIEEVIRRACQIVILTRLGLRIIDEDGKKKDNAYEMLWASARYLIKPSGSDGKIVDKTPPKFQAIDQVISWLVRPDRPVRTFEAASIFVTAIQVFECYLQARNGDPAVGDTASTRHAGIDHPFISTPQPEAERKPDQGPSTSQRFHRLVNGVWNGLDVLAELMHLDEKGLVDALSQSLDYYTDHIRRNWTDVFNLEAVRATLCGKGPETLKQMSFSAKERAKNAFKVITEQYDELLSEEKKGWLTEVTKDFRETKGEDVFGDTGGPDQHNKMVSVFNHDPYNAIFNKRTLPRARASLAELAVLPATSVKYRPWEGKDTERTLRRYLIGSDLLGSEHLQFAENLILAGVDIARQNVEDNIVYSEVRCATTGYCQSGLNKYDATELLCVAFDLGALLFGGWERGIHKDAEVEAERRLDSFRAERHSDHKGRNDPDVSKPARAMTRLGAAYVVTNKWYRQSCHRTTGSEHESPGKATDAELSGSDGVYAQTERLTSHRIYDENCGDQCATIWLWANPAQPQRWIRTSILLGGKRHKAEQISETVGLVEHYLQRGAEYGEVRDAESGGPKPGHLRHHSVPGSWWKRCTVVGFDLSGDESKKIENLRELLEPLFVSCAPITIHAGEAMDAASIWQAVHQLGAQRIGHGLRLRDSKKLLDHCVRRSICMELCPISNSFTNPFDISPPGVPGDDTVAKRDRYPVRDFIESWLDACINTDNRSLHQDSTLSDEYLKAAQLSGGLTRWDLLRIAKAGFKNAFLPKEEVARLMKHVEYEVYKIACERSGENEFPPVQRWPSSAGPKSK